MEKPSGVLAALTIIGPGRAGSSIARSAGSVGIDVTVLGRLLEPAAISGRCVLLCVPDAEIPVAAAQLAATGAVPETVGHVSGATTLEPLQQAGAAGGCFSLHPLQTIPDRKTDLTGAHAAFAASTPEAEAVAGRLAEMLGMLPFAVREEDRAAYHAAASIASNFLVTLEQTAAEIFGGIDIAQPREVLAPLVRRTLENWIADGSQALTGPIARGDRGTVERQRDALAGAHPELLDLYNAMASRTEALGNPTEVAR